MGWGDFKKRVKKNIENEGKKVEAGVKKLSDHLEKGFEKFGGHLEKAGGKLKGHIKKWVEASKDKKEEPQKTNFSDEEKQSFKDAAAKLEIIKDKVTKNNSFEDIEAEIQSISKILNDCQNNAQNPDLCYETIKQVNEVYEELQGQCFNDTCFN